MRRKLAIAAAVTLVVLGALVTRAVWEGRRALAEGDAAAARDDVPAAIDGWRRAARWYVPMAPHVDDAYARLRRVAEHADRPQTALAAWRAIRSSALATRWLVTPHDDLRALADRRIATLMARERLGLDAEIANDPDLIRGAAPDAGATLEEREAFYLGQLATPPGPSTAWVVIALTGFALWIGGCVHFARRGLDADDRLVRRVAGASGALFLVGVVVWVVGLYNA